MTSLIIFLRTIKFRTYASMDSSDGLISFPVSNLTAKSKGSIWSYVILIPEAAILEKVFWK